MNILLKQFLGILILFFSLKYGFNQNLNIELNSNQYNIGYNLSASNSSCNLLVSSNTPNDIKCLILCQMTLCKSLYFNVSTNSCTLNGSEPQLIKYDTLPGLNIEYILGIHFSYLIKPN